MSKNNKGMIICDWCGDLALRTPGQTVDYCCDDHRELAALTDKLTIMGCGHPQCVVVTSPESTSYCQMCKLEADVKFFKHHWEVEP